jgi:amidohydrolase
MQNDWPQQLDEIVERQVPEMISVRRHLHAHPESSGQEWQTTTYLGELLTKGGYHVRRGPDERGLLVDTPEVGPGQRLALRADIDALRIQEQTPSDYCSQVPGIMHGCGHDVHTAILCGTLLALRQAALEQILPKPLRWRGIFQPAEETNRGALEMIGAGGMHEIAAILALHVDPSRPVGTIATCVGPFTAACDEVKILVEGRGGHAARPHESIDSIAVAAQLISSIYLFVPRSVDSHDPVVVTFGQVHAGDSPNVIPARVMLRGTVRTLGEEVRRRTKEHIRQLARGLAQASGARIHVEFLSGPESVRNDPYLTALIRKSAAEVLGPESVHEIARPSMGGEDFANFLQQAPGAMFRLGCCGKEMGCPPLHSPQFDPDERCLPVGAKILARAAVLWSDPDPLLHATALRKLS